MAAGRRNPDSEVRGGREKPPRPEGQGWRPRPGAAARRNNPTAEARVTTRRSNPTPKAKGGGREEQPQVQGVVAVWA